MGRSGEKRQTLMGEEERPRGESVPSRRDKLRLVAEKRDLCRVKI